MPRYCGIFFINPDNKNQLLKVNDLSNSPQGFKDNYTSNENDFSYDNNGNMTADNNKGIVSITYNHLNLPIKLNFGAKGEITYLYNAAGQKLQKFVKDIVSNTNTTTDYLSGFQYLNTTLQFFPHAEGYVHYTRPLSNSQLGSFNYVFNYTDHLGNVRVSFANDPLQGNVLKILEENHYYAFGMKHENYNVTRLNFKYYPETGVELLPLPAVANESYNVKFNGKELQEELGLNFYDYGARNYDPAIGRWMNIDPLAEMSRRWTPYNYCYNNPIIFIDPDGMLSKSFGDEEFLDWKEENNTRNTLGETGSENDDWVEKKDKNGNKSIVWDKNVTSSSDKDLKKDDRYLGKAVVVFNGSADEKLGKDGTLLGKGAKSAEVTIYGPKGKDDIKTYDGLTTSSDQSKYSMIKEGEYEGRHQQMATSPYGKGSLTYRIHNLDGTTAILPDGGVNKANGKNFMEGIFFHRTNNNGNATHSSQGCLNIDGRQWSDVEKQLGRIDSFRIILKR